MAAGRTQPDPQKVFRAIAMIVSEREGTAKIRLTEVRRDAEEDVRKAG